MGDNNNNISSSSQNTHQQRITNFYYPHSTNIAIASSSTILEDEQQSLFKDQEKLLPIANVGRIMKQILPPNAKISKESKETMQECVSEFISFVTGEASDKCNKEKRKTVNGDDICWALENLGFDDYAESVKRYLVKYRDAEGEKANQNKAALMMVGETEAAGGCPTPFKFDPMENRRV